METFLPFLRHKNINGRIYNKDSFKDIDIDSFKGSFGMLLDHNDECPDVILVPKITHVIKNIEINDMGLFGEIEVLSTPLGNTVKELSKQGIRYVIRPSSFGDVNDDGVVHVKSIRSFDIMIANYDSFDPAWFNKRFNFIVTNKTM